LTCIPRVRRVYDLVFERRVSLLSLVLVHVVVMVLSYTSEKRVVGPQVQSNCRACRDRPWTSRENR
jgi:membrane-bound acyltransferase YfiQ involved in biofilm formation